MNAKEFLNENQIPDRTIRGRKPKGQFPEYTGLLSEIMDEYHQSKLNNNVDLDDVSVSFSPKQSHKVRYLCKEFYLWMQANDYDHNIPQRVENKAELFLRDKNVR